MDIVLWKHFYRSIKQHEIRRKYLNRIKLDTNAIPIDKNNINKILEDCVGYTHVLNDGTVQTRCDWTFRPSTEDKYGSYSSYKF